MRSTSYLHIFLICLFSINLSILQAQDGFDINTRPSVARTAPVCTHERDSSLSLVEVNNGGRTIEEGIFGNKQECLERNGLTVNGMVKEENYTNAEDLENYFSQCTFIQREDKFQDVRDITERVFYENRDRLVNGLWQDLASRSRSQLTCRVQTFQNYQTNNSAKQRMNQLVSSKFNGVLDRVRELILDKKRINSRNQQDVFSRIDCSGLAWFLCNDIVKEKNRVELSKHEMAIAHEFSKVPFGYEPDVAAALYSMAETGAFDESAFSVAVQKSEERYRKLEKYYRDRAPSVEGNNGFYCIDREFKNKAVGSGVAQQLIDSYPDDTMSRDQKIILQCKVNSKYKVAVDNRDSAANIAFMVGGAATAIMTAVPSGGSSLAAFGAIASAGLSAASFAYQVSKAHAACTKKNFVISPTGTEVCNPEEDFEKEMSERSLTECAAESAMAAFEAIPVGLDIRMVVRARRDMRIVDLANDAKIAEEVEAIRRTGRAAEAAEFADPANTPIVVLGTVDRYFSASRFDRIKASLDAKGITNYEDISPAVFNQLTPDEKLFVIENLTGGLKPEKGRQLERFFKKHPDGILTVEEVDELRAILQLDLRGARLEEAQEVIESLESKGFLTRAGLAASPQASVLSSPVTVRSTPQIQLSVSRLEPAQLASRESDLTQSKNAIITSLLGANTNRVDLEIAIDVFSGGAHRAKYLDNSRGSFVDGERYLALEEQLKRHPHFDEYRDQIEELIEIRIRQGNRLADEELAALKAEHPNVRSEEIDCKNLSALYPGSFPDNGKCSRVKFDEEVSGRYCYCGAVGGVGFNWLTKCPGSKSDFRSVNSYIDDFALPHASSPEMCVRTEIPKGKECYLGPTGATLSGFGGASQLLCINRAFSDRTRDAAQAGRLQGEAGELAVRPMAWSPFTTFDEFQDIVQDVSQRCPTICEPSVLLEIRQRYEAAHTTIMSRLVAPQDIRRFNEELEVFTEYFKDLENGRRTHIIKD